MKDVLLSRRGPLLGAAIYWLAIELSWNFAWHDGTYIAFWLPAGVFLALLIAAEFSEWLPLCAALIVTNIAFDCNHGAHFLYAVGMASSDVIEACLGALTFRLIFPKARRMDTLGEFIAFVGSVAIGCSAGGLGGAITNVHFGSANSFFAAWKTWTLGDGMAAIVVAPAVFDWILKPGSLREIKWVGWLETVVFVAGLGFTIDRLFNVHGGILSQNKSVIIPFLLWAALRFGPRGVALGNLFLTVMVVYLSGHTLHGPTNASAPVETGVTTMQIFLAVCSTIGFVSSFALAERNRALGHLKESEERLRMLSLAANEAIMICEEGRITDVNDQCLQLFGGNREDLIGRFATDFVESESKPVVTDPINHGKELVLRQRLRRNDGTIFQAETRGKILQINGRDLRLTTIRDVTEQTRSIEAIQLSEERFRQTFEGAGTGMALVSLDRKFVRVNAALCEMLGYTEAELLSRPASEFTHPDDRAQDGPTWQPLLEGKLKICRYEKRYLHRDGSVVWTNVVGSLLCDADGTPRHFSSQIRDITDRKKLEEAMRENERKLAVARDQAIESSRLKSEFLATMSHEIRTPMNAVIGMTSLLAATKLDREQSEMAHLVTNAAENLLIIINDILDFSRIEAGFLRIEAVSFDLRQVLNDTVSLLATRAKPKGLGLTLNLAELPNESYIGDAGRVRQVLTNLIGNAIKFTEAGKVSIDCELLPTRGKEAHIRINVSDTGIGIPLEQQGRLFQPFVQVDGSSTRRFGGTGLGLAITRHLVEAMGGKIGFRSEPGVGSTFWFELKFPRLARPKISPQKTPLVKRILYVDDDENDRDLISHRIRQCGYEIEVADSSKSALQKISMSQKEGFDMILLDWNMPGMDGFELAKKLRTEAKTAQTPLVMLSSLDRPREKFARASEAEIAAFLSKSIDRPKLAQSLHHVFAMSETAQSARDRSSAFTQRTFTVAPSRRLKILVAEDNEINQRVGALMLERMGHDAHFVDDGQAAIDRLNREDFDVVLMDCQMPVLDGYEATKIIRTSSRQANIPIIALTASARDEDKTRCLEAGMSVYVSKPLRLEQLQEAFEECGLLERDVPFTGAN